jgi:hypothetical protein
MDFTIAHMAADALALSADVGSAVLDDSLSMVDDVGLTTAAATLTRRTYWRNLVPRRGNRPCPCGRGSWRDCKHRWAAAAPTATTNVPRFSVEL